MEEEVEELSYEEEDGTYILKMFTLYLNFCTIYHDSMYYIESSSPCNLQITPS